MKKTKKFIAMFLALVLAISPLSKVTLRATQDVSEFAVTLGDDVDGLAIKPVTLLEGQVWTGKSIFYHHRDEDPIPEGRATVTLFAWGATFTNVDDEETLGASADLDFMRYSAVTIGEDSLMASTAAVDETPATEGETPATEEETPAAEDENASTEEETPPAEGENTSTEDETQATEDETPATEDETPSTEDETPSTEAETQATESETESETLPLLYEDGDFEDYSFFMPFAETVHMPLDHDHPYLVITDNLNEFKLDADTIEFVDMYGTTHSVTLGTPISFGSDLDGNEIYSLVEKVFNAELTIPTRDSYDIVWTIHQDLFVPDMVSISYEIYLDEDEFFAPRTYFSGPAASAKYFPNPENRQYYGVHVTVFDAFTLSSMNWAKGKVITGIIRDSEFEGYIGGHYIKAGPDNPLVVTIMGTNSETLSGEKAEDFPFQHGNPSHANNRKWSPSAVRVEVRVGATLYYYYFDVFYEWYDGGPGVSDKRTGETIPFRGDYKIHKFTVRDMQGLGLDIEYEFLVQGDSPGGNVATSPGGRTVRTNERYQIPYTPSPDNPQTPYRWDGSAIVASMDVVAEIALNVADELSGTVIIHKSIVNLIDFIPDYNLTDDWDVHDDTWFYVRVKDLNTGLYVLFHPPAGGPSAGNNDWTFNTFGDATPNNATLVWFSADVSAQLLEVPIHSLGTDTEARYVLEEVMPFATRGLVNPVYSYAEDFEDPADAYFVVLQDDEVEITVVNEFNHGIGTLTIRKLLGSFAADWNVARSDLFYVRIWDVQAQNWLMFKKIAEGDDAEFPGTFHCVGNHWYGFTEFYEGPVMLEIPIPADGTPVVLSNLWTWGEYEVVEFRRTREDALDPITGQPTGVDIFAAWDVWWATMPRDIGGANDGGRPGWSQRDYNGVETGWLNHPDRDDVRVGFGRWETYWERVPEMRTIGHPSDSDWPVTRPEQDGKPATPAMTWDEFHLSDLHWAVEFSASNGTEVLTPFDNIDVDIVNRYKYEAGNMFIYKVLPDWVDPVAFEAGKVVPVSSTFPGAVRSHLPCWGINNTTVFQARVYCDPQLNGIRNRLIFQEIYTGPGLPVAYRNIGHIEYGTGNVVIHDEVNDKDVSWVDIIRFTVNSPANLINLPVTDTEEYPPRWSHNYIIEEYFTSFSGHITKTLMYNLGSSLPVEMTGAVPADSGESMHVRVFNHYAHGDSIVIIDKNLLGFPEEWDIDRFTEFYVRITGADINEPYDDYGILEFVKFSDGSFGWLDDGIEEVDIPEGLTIVDEGPITFLPFSQNRELMLRNMSEQMRFAVEGSLRYEWDPDEVDLRNTVLGPVQGRWMNTPTGTRFTESDFQEFVRVGAVGDVTLEAGDEVEGGFVFRPIENYFLPGLFSHTLTEQSGSRLSFLEGHPGMDVTERGNLVVAFNNRWEHGRGTLEVHKHLVNPPSGITESTVFNVNIFDSTYAPGTPLRFLPASALVPYAARPELSHIDFDSLEPNTWVLVSRSVADGLVPAYVWVAGVPALLPRITSDIPISEEAPAVILDLWAGRRYVTREVSYIHPTLGLTTIPTHDPDIGLISEVPEDMQVLYSQHGCALCYDLLTIPPGHVCPRIIWHGDVLHKIVTNLWNPPVYRVIYHGSGNTGGTAPVDTDSPYEAGETVTLLDKGTLVRSGYTFLGWSRHRGRGRIYDPGYTFTMPTHNVHLYARWAAISYFTVTYDANGGTGDVPVDNNAYEAGDEVRILSGYDGEGAHLLEKEGYTFEGWSFDPDQDPDEDGVFDPDGYPGWLFQPGAFEMPANNVTLYAVWRPGSGGVTDSILGIEKEADVDTAAAGDTINYTITVTNIGNMDAYSITVIDFIDIDKVAFNLDDLLIDGAAVAFPNSAIFDDTTGELRVYLAEVLHNYENAITITFSVEILEAAAGLTVTNVAVLEDSEGEPAGFPSDEIEVEIDPTPGLFRVFYHGMGHTDGDAPVDDNQYAEGDGVYILHHGDMVKDGHVFTGWGLAGEKLESFSFDPDRHALYKAPAMLRMLYDAEPHEVWAVNDDPLETFIMPSGHAHLHAIWEPIEIDPTAPTLAKSANRTTAAVGDIINYTLTVHNPNADTLLDFVAVDRLNTMLVSFNLADVRINGAPVALPNSATITAGILRIHLAELPAGNTVITFPVTVLPEAAGRQVTNTAILEGPPDSGENGGGERPQFGPPTNTVEVEIAGTPPAGTNYPGRPHHENTHTPLLPPAPHTPLTTPALPGTGDLPTNAPPPGGFFIDEHIWFVRGDSNNDMRPNAYTSRADIAVVFYRLLRPEWKAFEPEPNPFNDVTGDEWFGRAVGILAHYGIIEGYEDGSFRPHNPITRKEFAAVVSRFDNLEETNYNPYTDLDPNDWAHKYILSATAKGWFVGHGGRFRPDANLTRAEMVTAINRILRRRILLADIPPGVHRFYDLDETHWAYADIMEAAHTHIYVRNADGYTELWVEILDTGLAAPYNE